MIAEITSNNLGISETCMGTLFHPKNPLVQNFCWLIGVSFANFCTHVRLDSLDTFRFKGLMKDRDEESMASFIWVFMLI